MTTLSRFVAVFGGLALLVTPARAQDIARRQDPSAGAPAGPFGGGGRFGRGAPPVPRTTGPLPGWQDQRFQKAVDLGDRGTFELSNTVGQIRISGTAGNSVRITAIKRV